MAGEILPPVESGGFVKPKEHLNHLFIVTAVHKVEERYDDKRKANGEVLTVDAHCFNCEGMAPPERVLIGAPYIASKIRRDGNLTLGYIQQLAPKPGFADGAIVLSEPKPEDIAPASNWWQSVKDSVIQGPADPTPQAAPASPWGQQAAPAPAPAATAVPSAAPGAPAAAQPSPWGAAAAPPPPPAKPTPEEVKAMPLVAVQGLVAQGVLTAQEAAYCGHQV